MALHLSQRCEWVRQSDIRSMSIECDRMGGVNLSQGVCDTEVPEVVLAQAAAAMRQGYNTYTRYDGLGELRQAIAAKLARFGGPVVDPEREVVVSAGATGAFYCTCLALLDPGDEVILFTPFYGYHVSTLVATGAVPVYVPLHGPDWRFDPADLERAVTSRTRAILVNTPSNPCGKVFDRVELQAIADFAERHDLFVFTDEIYEHFLYDGRAHISPATLPGMAKRTVTISGVSKTFSVTGWRVGYAVCDARFAETIGHFNDLIYVCAPAPLQIGVARGLDALGPEYYQGLSDDHQQKRDRICAALSRAGLTPHVPQGAYYVLADISRLPGANGKERAMRLLRATGVACVPGEAFFPDGDGRGLARFCYAKTDADLGRAIAAIEKVSLCGDLCPGPV